jgi:hypothetical protein
MNSNNKSKGRWHYINNYSNDKRIFTCGCIVEWHLDKIRFIECNAHSDKGPAAAEVRVADEIAISTEYF